MFEHNNSIDVILDADSTTIDTALGSIANYNHLFDDELTPYDLSHYYVLYEKAREKEPNLTDEEITLMVYSEEVIKKAKPTAFAKEFVETLHDFGCITHISTSRPQSQRDITEKSFKKHFPGLIKDIFLRGENQTKFESKLSTIKSLKPRAVIDDDADLMWELANAQESAGVIFILVDQPWNKFFRQISWKGVVLPNNAFIIRVGDYTKGSWEWRNYGWDQMIRIMGF